MKIKCMLLILTIVLAAQAIAGTVVGGGGLGKQLQEVAMSETMMSAPVMAEILDNDLHADIESPRKVSRSVMPMESFTEAPAGVLIEVKSTDFNMIAKDASNGKGFIYRDLTVRTSSIDAASRIVIMALVEDSSLTIIVKDAVDE